MYAEPLGARPMARGPSHDMLAGGEEAGGGADSGGYLAGPPSGGPSAEDNVAAAAAAAAVAGMHHSYLAASPQEATCSTSMQLHTPMTGAHGEGGFPWVGQREGGSGRVAAARPGCPSACCCCVGAPPALPSHRCDCHPLPPLPAGESTAGMLQSSTYSGEPSPMSRPDGRDATTHSAHSSPLRPSMGGLLEGADLAAVQNSLAGMRLQVSMGRAAQHLWRAVCSSLEVGRRSACGGVRQPSRRRGFAPCKQCGQAHVVPPGSRCPPPSSPPSSPQENGHMHSPISGGTGMSQPSLSDGATSSWRALSPDHLQHQQHQAAQQHAQSAPGSAAMSPLHHAAAAAQQQAAAAAAGSAGMSPVKPLGIPPHDDTIVYSALSRPLPDYALTHVFNQVGPGAPPGQSPGQSFAGLGWLAGWLERSSSVPAGAPQY